MKVLKNININGTLSNDGFELSKDENILYLGASSKNEYVWIVDIQNKRKPIVLDKVSSFGEYTDSDGLHFNLE